MNIGIIGGGNIGTELAGELSKRNFNIYLYTSKPHLWSKDIIVNDLDNDLIYESKIYCITNKLEEVINNVEVVIITLPSNAFNELASSLKTLNFKDKKFIFLPGTGGAEFVFHFLIEKGNYIIGFQRVPAVYRLKTYGKEVTISGRRKEGLYFSILPKKNEENIKNLCEKIFNMPCILLPNYLSVTLTPSNPILHTTRLYTMFNGFKVDTIFPRNFLFYKEWDIPSSINLINCNNELMKLKEMIMDLDLSNVKDLLIHYESNDAISLTNKISSIKSLSTVFSPMIKVNENEFKIDWDSRYFKADFPNGLIIIKAIALIINLKTPHIDEVIKWYQESINKEFIDFKENKFGKDINLCNIPQNFGIDTYQKLIDFYTL